MNAELHCYLSCIAGPNVKLNINYAYGFRNMRPKGAPAEMDYDDILYYNCIFFFNKTYVYKLVLPDLSKCVAH